MSTKGFIASGEGRNTHYSEPKARVLDRAAEMRDVTIVGKTASGETQIWSTQSDQAVEAKLTAAFPALAELTA